MRKTQSSSLPLHLCSLMVKLTLGGTHTQKPVRATAGDVTLTTLSDGGKYKNTLTYMKITSDNWE